MGHRERGFRGWSVAGSCESFKITCKNGLWGFLAPGCSLGLDEDKPPGD